MGEITPYSAVHLLPEVRVQQERWNRVPPQEIVAETAEQIRNHGIRVIRVKTAEEALTSLQQQIPSRAEVMQGSSTTLIEIGYERLLASGTVDWINLHEVITAENDDRQRYELRRKAVTAEYFLSGVNAIAQTGELVSCDRTGSRVGAWPYAAKHLILVAGINKIVSSLPEAFQRIRDYVLPLEDSRARKASGVGSRIGKCVVLAHEEVPGRITLILIDESLGY